MLLAPLARLCSNWCAEIWLASTREAHTSSAPPNLAPAEEWACWGCDVRSGTGGAVGGGGQSCTGSRIKEGLMAGHTQPQEPPRLPVYKQTSSPGGAPPPAPSRPLTHASPCTWPASLPRVGHAEASGRERAVPLQPALPPSTRDAAIRGIAVPSSPHAARPAPAYKEGLRSAGPAAVTQHPAGCRPEPIEVGPVWPRAGTTRAR